MVDLTSVSSHESSPHHRERPAVNSPKKATVATTRHCWEDLRHPIHTIVAELVDPLPCTRRSALGKLQCALTSDILTTCDPEKDTKPLLRSLLEWFNLPSPSHEILVLSIISRLAQDDENRKLLFDLGAVEFMEQYQTDCCHTIVPYIATLLHNLHKQNTKGHEGTARSMYLRDTGLGYVIPTTQPPLQCVKEGPYREDDSLCKMACEQIPCNMQNCNQSCDSYLGECQAKTRPCPLITDNLERKEQFKDLCLDSNCERFPCGKTSRRPASGSQAGSPASATCTEHAASRSWSSSEGLEKPTVPVLTKLNSLLKPSEPHVFADISDALDPILPRIGLEESDDKYLFDLNATLQYPDDQKVLLGALKELREAVVFDFHPEAILQKYSIVQNAIILLQKITDSNMEQLVFDFLLELVRQIKAALKLSREAGFQVHLDKESPLEGLQERGGSARVKSELELKSSYPVYRKLSSCNALDSGKTVHLLSGLKLDNKGNIQPVIALGRILHLVALQLISLLVNEQHRDMAFAILYELLPLLKPPTDKSLDEKVQVQFTQYFHALCEVLQALNGTSQDLETLCMDVTAKRNFDKRAHHIAPLLKVLCFSSELLCLLQPTQVAGLLPSPLVKALITVAGDLILAECTFGMHKKFFSYSKFLDPEFFKSYTCATEASFTLHVLVKELASSEEAVAQWKAKRPGALLKINTELLLKCMIQAVPNYSYFNHKYLVPRVIQIVPEVLRMELVRACQGSANHRAENKQCDTIQPSSQISVEGLISQARSVIWLLLSHPSAPVCQVAYDSLLEVSSKERWQVQQHNNSKPKLASGWEEACTIWDARIFIDSDEPDWLLHRTNGARRPLSVLHRLLIFGTSIMGEIITVGLHDTATCKQSAVLLQHLVEELSEKERAQIIPGYPWIACCTYLSADLVSIVEKVNSLLFPAKPSSQKGCTPPYVSSSRPEWAQLSCVLRLLFSSSTSQRCRVSTELLLILREWFISEESVCWWLRKLKNLGLRSIGYLQTSPDMPLSDPVQFLNDPFQHCLKFKEATSFSLAFGSPTQEVKKREKLGVPPDGQKKVEDLLRIFKAISMGVTLRKTAIEQLTWLIQDQALRSLLKNDEELFKALIAEIVDWMRKEDTCSEGSFDITSSWGRPGSPERMDSSDTSPNQLGIACLSLLARLTPASDTDDIPSLRDMLMSNSCNVLWLLIPLVFHPFKCVRKDMALLLASTLFSSDLLFRGLKAMDFNHDQTHYHLPTTGDIFGASQDSSEQAIRIAVPFPFIGGHVFPCQVVSVAIRPPLQTSAQGLVDEQLVHRVIAQSVLLEGGHENLLNSLESRVASAGDPVWTIELQAMACLSVLHADLTIKKLLKLLADPQLCFGSEIQFLEELEAQCFRHPQAAKMLARASWVLTFERFLTTIPSTPEESTQLLKVLRLVQIIINSKSAGSAGLLFLTMVSKQILLPIIAKSPTPRVGANLHHAIVLIEGYPAVDMDFTILRLFVDILLCSKEHKDASLFGQIAAALAKGTSLLSVLLLKFVKGPSAPYLCCVLAVQCIALVAKGIAATFGSSVSQAAMRRTGYLHQKDRESSSEVSSDQQGDTGLGNSHRETEILQQESEGPGDQGECLWTTIGNELVEVVLPLIKHMAHLHSHHFLSLRHKRLVREIVSCLWSITSCVPPYLWEDLWYSTGITYWLSRLLNDQEATIRGIGFGILAVLASPVTSKTRALLQQNWPELADVAVQTVLNTQECFAVRGEALRFLISATIWSFAGRSSSTMERTSLPAGFETADSLGVNAAFQRYKFWILFTAMLQERDGTPGFYRVLLEFTLKLTISDLGFIKSRFSVNPQVFQALIEHLAFATTKERGNTSKCLHSPDIYGAKSYVGEILCILAQQEDAHIQSLLQNEILVENLLCALSYCLGCQNLENPTGNERTKSETKERQVMIAQKRYSLTEYERLEAIFHISEALNLVVSQLMQAAAPQSNRATNHIRVDDVMSFNLRDGKPQGGQPQSGFQTCLGGMIGKSGVCRDISHTLSKVPLIKDLQSAGKNDSGRILSVLLRRMQLAVCALLATLLSEDSLAKAVLETDGVAACENASGGEHQKPPHLAPILYNSFLLIMKDVHELGRQPKISHDGDFLIYLHTILFTVGVALQNLISFSSEAKQYALDSDLSPTLVGHAYESYALLGSCGLAPMRTILTTSLMGSTNHRSKRCNKVPKMVNQPIRPSIWSRKAKQGKLSEHHRSLLLGELTIYFRVLKNLVFENPAAAEGSGSEGIFDVVRLMWGFSLSEEELLHEILGLLCNLAAQSDAAKEAMACQTQISYQGGKGGSLMDYAAAIVLRLPSDQLSYTLAVGLLQILVTMAKARAIFLRKQYLSEFLQHYGQSVHSNDVLRQHLILQLLINVSVYPNGQKMLSKGLSDGSMLDLVLDTVEQTHYVPASSSALFLLRNLAFCRETRFFFLCNERTLPILVKSLGSSSLEARANAASALWILTSTERRISSVLKKIDACPSLVAAHEASKLHLKIFQTHVQKNATELGGTGRCATTVSKMGKLVTHIEQSLFAVNQLIGGMHVEYN